MRGELTVVLLIVMMHFGYAQELSKNQLLVLHTENVTINETHSVMRFDTLQLNDSVQISNGILIAADHYGNIRDWQKDGNWLITWKNTTKNTYAGIDLNYLFDTTRIPTKLIHFGSNYRLPHLVISSPEPYTGETIVSRLGCFRWMKSSVYPKTPVEVKVEDVFGDLSRSYLTKANQIAIDFSDFRKLDYEDQVIITITSLENPNDEITFLQDIYTTDIHVSPCSAKTKIEYFQVATQLERAKDYKSALKFYRKAAKSTKTSFYKEMLQNYQSRIKGKALGLNY